MATMRCGLQTSNKEALQGAPPGGAARPQPGYACRPQPGPCWSASSARPACAARAHTPESAPAHGQAACAICRPAVLKCWCWRTARSNVNPVRHATGVAMLGGCTHPCGEAQPGAKSASVHQCTALAGGFFASLCKLCAPLHLLQDSVIASGPDGYLHSGGHAHAAYAVRRHNASVAPCSMRLGHAPSCPCCRGRRGCGPPRRTACARWAAQSLRAATGLG